MYMYANLHTPKYSNKIDIYFSFLISENHKYKCEIHALVLITVYTPIIVFFLNLTTTFSVKMRVHSKCTDNEHILCLIAVAYILQDNCLPIHKWKSSFDFRFNITFLSFFFKYSGLF